jgi:hypothetical protein
MFCAPGFVFGGSEGVGSHFHVLRAPTRFRRFRACRVPISCFARPDSSSAVLRASDTVIMFCAPGLVYGSTEGVRSRFHVFRSWSFFRSYRGRQVPFSCFALPDSLSVVPRAPLPVFMFSALGHVLGGTEGVGSLFHVLRSRTRFRRNVGVGSDFHVLRSRTSFRWYRGVGSRFHVLRSRTHFRWYRGRRVPFPSGHVFGGTKGVGSRFTCFPPPDSFSTLPGASGHVFMFCAPGLIFGGTKSLGCLYSCFALQDSFSAVRRASSFVFTFCAPGLIFGGTGGAGSHFLILRSRTHFRRYRGCLVSFSHFAFPD